MNPRTDPGISRRRFLVSTSEATAGVLLARRYVFAQGEGLVQPEKQQERLLSLSRNCAVT